MSRLPARRQRAAGPMATVVVPVRNDAQGIARCLGGLSRQCVHAEIVVVDDGSTDGTAEVARRLGARVLSSGGRGAAAARNLGVQCARSEVVLFTDADCIPCPGWAKALLEPFGDPRVVASKGTYRSRQTGATARFVQVEYEERYARMLRATDVDFLDTYSLAVRRRDLVAVGGFDEAFRGASVEDQEMSFRLHARGRFVFVPTAVVEHTHADSPRAYFRKKLRIGRGKATLLRRHRDRIKGDSHTPASLVVQVPLVLLALAALLLTPLFGSTLLAVASGLAFAPVCLSSGLVFRAVARHGPAFLAAAMALTLLRAWALGLGVGWGLCMPLARLEGPRPTVAEGEMSGDDSGAFAPTAESEWLGRQAADTTRGEARRDVVDTHG